MWCANGYTQVYCFWRSKKFSTQGAINSNIPVTDGEQIYMQEFGGGDQIFLYNFTEQTIQITAWYNTNPKLTGKYCLGRFDATGVFS
jgi:hypothetical protein